MKFKIGDQVRVQGKKGDNMKIISTTYQVELTDVDLDNLRLILNCTEDALKDPANEYNKCISKEDINSFRRLILQEAIK